MHKKQQQGVNNFQANETQHSNLQRLAARSMEGSLKEHNKGMKKKQKASDMMRGAEALSPSVGGDKERAAMNEILNFKPCCLYKRFLGR